MNLPHPIPFPKWLLLSSALIVLLLVWPRPGLAQTPPLGVDPPALTLTGPLDGGPLVVSLRLSAATAVTNVQIFASDLQPVSADGPPRDPIPGNAVTVLPAAGFSTLRSGSVTALAVRVEPPGRAGRYSGTLTIRWQDPTPGGLTLPMQLHARTRPVLAVQSPAQITINAVPNERITRQIVLRETGGGSPLTGLQALPQDLLTADGRRTLPAGRLALVTPAVISGGQVATAALTVSLPGASAGAYSGSLLFTTPWNQLVSLPVNVNVKHGPPLVLLVLLVGVILGVGLTLYQERGRPRDQVVVRVVAVRQAMGDDALLAQADGPARGFHQALAQQLATAESHLRSDAWPAAADAVTQAERLLDRWRSARPAWVTVLTYLHGPLAEQLQPDGSQTVAELELKRQSLLQTAPDSAGPLALRQAILELEQNLNRYAYLRNLLEEVGQLRTNPSTAAPDKREQWRLAQARLQARLERLSPGGDEDWPALEQEIRALLAEIAAAATDEAAKSRAAGAPGSVRPASAVPVISRLKPLSLPQGEDAASRLALFTWLAYGVAGLVLVWSGYVVLYADQPTFGARPTDYLTLLTWGLGGQAAFATVAQRLINWGAGQTDAQSQTKAS